MNENQLYELKLNIFKQATLYIEKFGSFAPFASSILNDAVTPVGYYTDEDSVDVMNAAEMIQEQLSDKIKAGDADGAALAFDVRIEVENDEGVLEKRDAMCLRISVDEITWNEGYFLYKIVNGECVWK
ncbi:hypothetical protein [Sphingobacterium multivorum]|uniref:hypothetical protein n=2 Tax=Sphingobacterium multivorum TaxID=28454 RepID=UPI003DA26A46